MEGSYSDLCPNCLSEPRAPGRRPHYTRVSSNVRNCPRCGFAVHPHIPKLGQRRREEDSGPEVLGEGDKGK